MDELTIIMASAAEVEEDPGASNISNEEAAAAANTSSAATSFLFTIITNNETAPPSVIIGDDHLSETNLFYWYRYDSALASGALIAAYALVFIAGLIGNVLVIIAVLRTESRTSSTTAAMMRHCTANIFFANLAFADLLVIIACLPFTLISNLIYPWILGATICKLLPFFQGVSVCASVYSLVAVAVERCRSITSPLKQRMTTRTCRIIIAMIWIVAVLITSPWLVVFQQHSLENANFLVCTEMWPEPWMEVVYFSVVHLILCYVVPLLIIVISYVLVGHRIWRRQILGAYPLDEVERQARQLQQKKLRALRMVAIVVAAFALAWLPLYSIFTRIKLSYIFTSNWMTPGETELSWWPTVISVAQWMSSANSCVNPFLYHFLDPRFRCRFKQLLVCVGRQQQPSTTIRMMPDQFLSANVPTAAKPTSAEITPRLVMTSQQQNELQVHNEWV